MITSPVNSCNKQTNFCTKVYVIIDFSAFLFFFQFGNNDVTLLMKT